jgi:hypothetical protein
MSEACLERGLYKHLLWNISLQEDLHESVFCHHYTMYDIQIEACNKQTIFPQQFVQGVGGET